MRDYDEIWEEGYWGRRLSARPKCTPLDRKGEHQDVQLQNYNTSGALLGPHFRCAVCNSVWNQYAHDGDFPDTPTIHSK